MEGSSIQGTLFEDILHLGQAARGNRPAPVWLGCHSRETNFFRTQVPTGIMGLGEHSWDVIEALAAQKLDKQVFTLCLAERGGAMTFGGINETWTPLSAPLQWTAYSGSYVVQVSSIDLMVDGNASEVLKDPVGSFHVDSGTTFTYFTIGQAQSLRLAVEHACERGACGSAIKRSRECWDASSADLERFPALHFGLGGGGSVYEWIARGYLHEEADGAWCYSFLGEPPLTLGMSFMQNHLLVFDRDERKIGFAPSHCPSIGSRADPLPASLEVSSPDADQALGSQSSDTTARGNDSATSGSIGTGTTSGSSNGVLLRYQSFALHFVLVAVFVLFV